MKQSQNLLLILVVGALIIGAFWVGNGGSLSTTEEPGISVGGVQSSASSGVVCSNTLTTAVTLSIRNGDNTTGRDTFDTQWYAYKVGADGSETYYSSGTTSTADSHNFDCGNKYRLRVVSSDGDEGDSQVMTAVEAGNGIIGPDKRYVEFTATGAAMPLDVVGKQHAVVEFKVFDNLQNAFMYNEEDSSATDFELTGANFTSSTGNTTATAVGASGKLDFELQVEATQIDSAFFADGGYVMLTAPAATWDVASVYVDGTKLSETSLNSFESRLWGTTYQQYFKVPAGLEIDDQIHKIKIQINALSGVNPDTTSDIVVALADMGAARQTAGNNVLYSGATDASSPAAIYTLQTARIATS